MKRDKTTCIKGRERMKSDDKNTFCCVLYIRVVISGCCCWFGLDKKKETATSKSITNRYALF